MSIIELQTLISPKFSEQSLLDIVKKRTEVTNINIRNIDFGDSSSRKGDSYLSQICRFIVHVTGNNKVGGQEVVAIPVIAKSLPRNLARRKTFRSTDFFKNEIIFFEKVLPAFDAFQDAKGIIEKFDRIPVALSSWSDGNDDYIALLDVSGEGYATAERGPGLDYEHTLAILRLLARFHALSLAFKDQDSVWFEEVASSLQETYFDEKYRQWYGRFQQNVIAVSLDCVEKELPVSYFNKFKQFVNQDLFLEICKCVKKRGPLSVVTHGDVWLPNFLFKYDGGKPTDVMMIDFQLARYATLAIDVTFFLFICADTNLLSERWDDIISDYHNTLVENVVKFGSKRDLISIDTLHEELRDSMVCSVAVIIEGLTMSLLGEEDVADLDGIQGDQAVPLEEVWLVRPFKEKEKRKRFASLIKFVMDKNFI